MSAECTPLTKTPNLNSTILSISHAEYKTAKEDMLLSYLLQIFYFPLILLKETSSKILYSIYVIR